MTKNEEESLTNMELVKKHMEFARSAKKNPLGESMEGEPTNATMRRANLLNQKEKLQKMKQTSPDGK